MNAILRRSPFTSRQLLDLGLPTQSGGAAIALRNCAMYPGMTTAAKSANVLVQASTGIAVPLAHSSHSRFLRYPAPGHQGFGQRNAKLNGKHVGRTRASVNGTEIRSVSAATICRRK